MTKDIQPGKWDTSVGGHIGLGESVPQMLFSGKQGKNWD